MAAKKSEDPKQTTEVPAEAAIPEKSPSGTVVKKIKPYPFETKVLLKEGVPPAMCSVLKLTLVGFLMRVEDNHHFKVGDNHQAQFQLPGTPFVFDEPIKIIKTYDSLSPTSPKDLAKHYTVEAHFRQLSIDKRKQILKFLELIKQK